MSTSTSIDDLSATAIGCSHRDTESLDRTLRVISVHRGKIPVTPLPGPAPEPRGCTATAASASATGPFECRRCQRAPPARPMARPWNDGGCSPPMTGLLSQVSMSCSTCASAVSTSSRRQRSATPACTCSAMASSTLDSRARWRIRCNGRIAPEADSANRTIANPAPLASVRATASTSAMNPWRRKPCAASTSASNRAATRGRGNDGVPLQLPREDQRALAGLGRRENLPAAAHRSGGRLHYGMISASARRSRMAMPAWSVSRRSRIAYGAENSPSTVPGQFRVRPCAPGSSQAAE